MREADGDAGVAGFLEEGPDGDGGGAVGVEAAVVLAVGLFPGIAGIEGGKAVEVAASGFPEVVAEGEADVAPVGVGGGEVQPGLLNAAGEDLDVAVFAGGEPVGGFELFLCHQRSSGAM